ncbi:hypothetical protein ACFU6K_00660 [Kitasatospora sp. NPDC057512]|uniref:hypothetical protein n=1 Tax=Kitasatospora sp. NPDC057512 TaxID=3346154 RepID=UPI0036AACEA3
MFAMRGKEYLTAVCSENGLLELHPDHAVLTSEADHRKWLRIAERVRAAGLAVYDPRADPDAVEHPPLVRFRADLTKAGRLRSAVPSCPRSGRRAS